MSLILKAQLTIYPQYRADFLRHMQELIQSTLKEEGCSSFGCFEDAASPNTFLVLAEWRSYETLEQHEYSAHVADFKAQIKAMIASRKESLVYTISQVETLNFPPKSP